MVDKLLNKVRKQGLLNVFMIVNPLAYLVAVLLIKKFKFDSSNILLVSSRGPDLSLLNHPSLKLSPKRRHHIIQKVFFSSYLGIEVLKKVKKRNFILYTPFSNRDSNWLIKSKKCVGHFYIEEGQGSYLQSKLFNYNDLSFFNKISNNFKNKENFGDAYGNFYRSDSSGFIAIHPDSFPSIYNNEKYILDDLNFIKKIYTPKTTGIKNFALGCAERRLINGDWRKMIDTLINLLPSNSIIKLHPSFYTSMEKVKTIKEYIEEKSYSRITLCSEDVILELEMLYEKKISYGPQTTLSKYAKYLGSSFYDIKLFD